MAIKGRFTEKENSAGIGVRSRTGEAAVPEGEASFDHIRDSLGMGGSEGAIKRKNWKSSGDMDTGQMGTKKGNKMEMCH